MTEQERLVAGRYRLRERIGAGAMGIVWRADDERLRRTVAVKQLLLQPGIDAQHAGDARARAMREGRIAARLQHPNAVTVYDVAEEDDQPWLVMEYVPSRSLATVLAEQGTLSPERVASMGAQVASALAAAHAVGVVHRDVKPGNVLLTDDGVAKITDFGISRAADDVKLTATGLVSGTPAYLAPEMAKGENPAPASDVFALGSTLYAAVEGQPPFGLNENPFALLYAVAGGQVKPPANAGPLTPVLMRLLQADPDHRPTMREAHEQLAGLAGQATVAIPSQAPPPPPSPAAGIPLIPSRPPTPPPTPLPTPPPTRVQPPRTQRDLPPPRPTPLPTPMPPPAEPMARRRPIGLVVAIVVAIVLLGGAAYVVSRLGGHQSRSGAGGQAQSGPATPGPSRDTSVAVVPDGPLTLTQMRQLVVHYYGLLPGNLDDAWALLSGQFRAKTGRGSFDRFYASIQSVSVDNFRPDGPDSVLATVTFTKTNGAVSHEPYRFTISRRADGTGLVIDNAVRV